jgi:hypothetical protein
VYIATLAILTTMITIVITVIIIIRIVIIIPIISIIMMHRRVLLFASHRCLLGGPVFPPSRCPPPFHVENSLT